MTTIRAAAVETLAADFAGQLIQPKDVDYATARQIWNGHVQRRPALIARCRRVADVMAAVRFCREHELPASVRGGGHAVAGHAVCEGGVVIDLSAMTGARVDPLARTIQLEGGCWNAHLDRESQAFGFAATGGIVSHTGIGGLTLSAVPIFSLGGAMARVPEETTAFPYRDASHDVGIVASWLAEQAGEADRHMEWVRGFFRALEPYSRGVYVNFTSDDANERVRAAYSDQQWARLTALKSKYDPTNFFRMNANIQPA